ncbi:type II toxin-antitoxin system VapC family toxin [Sandaracinobacter neustonicus]|uniref:Ribonuclease VapC n=1 Tax=Sandaracinobacter neustonicus TaxID=1715348 RepID=A0A501XG24_9SPHN|nr:type II toxin-antitoxin system VapC family toxin [Sandaracinobacter neustonicus]TPE59480.1 type II toxin-antitoxin system VapC family toxin [Sandaracinobacter neustonicus]
MLVVDTSVAVKWVISEASTTREAGTEQALALLAHGLMAPDLLAIEFANVLWKRQLRRDIGADQAEQALAILPETVLLQPSQPYLQTALSLAVALEHPVYDCLFLACAAAHDAELVTADERLATLVQHRNTGIRVTNLADWIDPTPAR